VWRDDAGCSFKRLSEEQGGSLQLATAILLDKRTDRQLGAMSDTELEVDDGFGNIRGKLDGNNRSLIGRTSLRYYYRSVLNPIIPYSIPSVKFRKRNQIRPNRY